MGCGCNSYDPCYMMESTSLSEISTEMMRRTRADMLERGIIVYNEDGRLYTTDIQKGNGTSITIEPPTKWFGLLPVGDIVATIHTHPLEEYESLFSTQDIHQMIESDLDFSVAIFDEGGRAVADVFDTRGFGTVRELVMEIDEPVGSIGYAERGNEMLHLCKVELGRL